MLKMTECILKHRQEHMYPDVSFALGQSEGAPVQGLQGIVLQISQDEEQPILRGGQRAVLVGGVTSLGSWQSVQPPFRHMGLELLLEGLNQRPKLFHYQARHIKNHKGFGFDVCET